MIDPSRNARREQALIERDAYDEAAFERALERYPSFRKLIDSGTVLMPSFPSLTEDLFCVFFKYTLQRKEAAAHLAVSEQVINWVLSSRGFEQLNAETTLDEDRSALTTELIATRWLETLKDPSLFSRSELLQQFELEQLEERKRELDAQLESADEIAKALEQEGEAASQGLSEATEGLKEEQATLEEAIAALLEEQRAVFDSLPARVESDIRHLVEDLPQQIEAAEELVEGFDTLFGLAEETTSAKTKMQLGRRLMESQKLLELFKLAGQLKEHALSRKRRAVETPSTEIHAIKQSGTLSTLLPSELMLLRHPVLRRDFHRRFVENTLQHYEIRGEDTLAKGPVVVCIDGSGSMQGPKELWAKAVALTFMELCRIRRRAFRAVVFSGRDQDTRRFDLLETRRNSLSSAVVEHEELWAFVNYFPRGGTQFEHPIDVAIESLGEKAFRRADIILITDGDASLHENWVQGYEARRKSMGFELHAVLIDTGSHRSSTLERIADSISPIKTLVSDALSELFEKA